MIRKPITILSAALLVCASSSALAGPDDFKTGPLIDAYGPVAPMQSGWKLPASTKLRVVFDAAKPAEENGLNRTLESAARFLNMHTAAGVDPDNIDLAVVIHGGAAIDLLNPEAFAKARNGASNKTADLIAALVKHDVKIILCGQTAAYRNIDAADVSPGVEIALSAMTAHAQLQAEGYTLNPF